MTNDIIDDEVAEIVTSGKKYTFPNIEILIHTKEVDLSIHRVNDIHISSNFTTDITDKVFIDFQLPAGTFRDTIYSNKDLLEMTLILTYGEEEIVLKYEAILNTEFRDRYTSIINSVSNGTLDKLDFIDVSCQCVDPLLLSVKNETTSGVYHDTDISSVIKCLISDMLNKVTVLGSKLDFKLNMYDSDNSRKYKNIIIKPHSKVIRLPYDFQHNEYGIYDNGIGIYFTHISDSIDTKYDVDIYPLFDFNRFDNESKRTKLYIVNSNIANLSQNDVNFYYKDGIYKGIVTDVQFRDKSENDKYNKGTGIVETVDTLSTSDTLYNVTNDKIVYDGSLTYGKTHMDGTSEYYAKFIDIDQNDNPYLFRSGVNKSLGVIGIFNFPYTNMEFVYPGMPVKYLFSTKDEGTLETSGIVQGIETMYDVDNKTVSNVLMVMLNKV